jgi:hypothetical protein
MNIYIYFVNINYYNKKSDMKLLTNIFFLLCLTNLYALSAHSEKNMPYGVDAKRKEFFGAPINDDMQILLSIIFKYTLPKEDVTENDIDKTFDKLERQVAELIREQAKGNNILSQEQYTYWETLFDRCDKLLQSLPNQPSNSDGSNDIHTNNSTGSLAYPNIYDSSEDITQGRANNNAQLKVLDQNPLSLTNKKTRAQPIAQGKSLKASASSGAQDTAQGTASSRGAQKKNAKLSTGQDTQGLQRTYKTRITMDIQQPQQGSDEEYSLIDHSTTTSKDSQDSQGP